MPASKSCIKIGHGRIAHHSKNCRTRRQRRGQPRSTLRVKRQGSGLRDWRGSAGESLRWRRRQRPDRQRQAIHRLAVLCPSVGYSELTHLLAVLLISRWQKSVNRCAISLTIAFGHNHQQVRSLMPRTHSTRAWQTLARQRRQRPEKGSRMRPTTYHVRLQSGLAFPCQQNVHTPQASASGKEHVLRQLLVTIMLFLPGKDVHQVVS